jgi:formylglycine-generating enzyme required for sulfatase activity
LIDSQTTDGTTLHPLDLIQIASGSFMMGCNSAVDSECSANENPYHSVTLSAYSIERTEVTQASYQACITAGSCATPACDWMPATKASYPVTCVTWQDAANYCGWANARLPTEAEWERAARGTDGRKFPWGNAAPTCSLLNYASCNVGTVIVGSYSNGASPDGVLDMAGNVTEWVADWYSATYYGSSPSNDPTGPASSTGYRSSRGGSFGGAEISIRVSNRNGFNDPISALDYRGFRCAR